MKIQSTVLRCALLVTAILPIGTVRAQIVNDQQTAAALANALVGSNPGVTVTNPVLTCPSRANGTFSGVPSTSKLSIGNGIVLTTGSATDALTGACNFASTSYNAPGDAQLTTLTGTPTVATHDACVLEFDLSAQGNEVSFRYQFGSEEYPIYTCSQYNDVFGFFVSGGSQYPTPTNIAIVPTTTNTPVSINTVNSHTAPSLPYCPNPYSTYFIDNSTGCVTPVYDGLTTVLTAKATVTPCSTYHFKLGIADASDYIYDSGVFLESGSLKVSPPVIVGCPSDINQGTGPGATQCGANVTWTEPTAGGDCLGTTTSRTGPAPGSFFQAGTTTPITYTFTNAGGTSTCSFNVTVYDNTPPTITCPPAITVGCAPASTGTPTATDNCPGTITYSSSDVSTQDPNPAHPGYYSYTITRTWTAKDAAGNTSASCNQVITVQKTPPVCSINLAPCASTGSCTGTVPNNIYLGYGPQCATMTASGGGTGATYNWTGASTNPLGGTITCTSADCSNATFTPGNAGNYTYNVLVTNALGCTSTCSVTFCVKDARDPQHANKVYVCHNGNTISISTNAVAAHLCNHTGDHLGSCGDAPCPAPSSTSSAKMAGPGATSGISDLVVKAYPNPFTNAINVTFQGTYVDRANVMVYDATGRLVQTLENQPAGTDISVGQMLAPGIYTIEVKNNEVSQHLQVVKQ